MAVKTVAVYDCSESYIEQFVNYVNRKKEQRMEVLGFTDLKALEDFLSRRSVDVLLFSMEDLVDEPLVIRDFSEEDIPEEEGRRNEKEEDPESRYEKFIEHRNVREFIYLGERRNSRSRIRHINKYQSMKKILAELQEILAPKQDPGFDLTKEETERAALIAVYDPAQKCSSIQAALEIAEEFSVQKETLLIDFDRFPQISQITGTGESGSLSDLIYFYRTNPQRLKEGLEEKCRRFHNLDFLTGPEDREDMDEITEKDWPAFLKDLAVCGGYEVVVVYMSEAFKNLESFFDSCMQIYVPTYTDEVSTGRMYAFAKYLYGKGRKDLFEKVQNLYIHPPMAEENRTNYAGSLSYGTG